MRSGQPAGSAPSTLRTHVRVHRRSGLPGALDRNGRESAYGLGVAAALMASGRPCCGRPRARRMSAKGVAVSTPIEADALVAATDGEE